MSQPLRIALIDWNREVRSARRAILDATHNIDVVFESDGYEVDLKQLPNLLIDVIVIDQQLEQGSGVVAFKKIRQGYEELSEVPKALLTAPFHLGELSLLALEAGMQGLVSVEDGAQGLVNKIRSAAEGQNSTDLEQLYELVGASKLAPGIDFEFTQSINSLPVRKRAIVEKLSRSWAQKSKGSKTDFTLDQLEPLVAPLRCITVSELAIKLLQNGFLNEN